MTGKDNVTPTMPADERRRASGRGNTGFGHTMAKARKDGQETTGMVTPTLPAEERRAGSTYSDGIGQIAREMAGSTRSEQMRPSQPLPPERRQRGDRPG